MPKHTKADTEALMKLAGRAIETAAAITGEKDMTPAKERAFKRKLRELEKEAGALGIT